MLNQIKHPLPLVTFSLFTVIGLILINQYGEYPIVRNSLIYAAIIQGINETSIWQAATFAQNKPLGFAILSLPFSNLWGVNLGLKMSSWFATIAFGLISIGVIKLIAHTAALQGQDNRVFSNSDPVDRDPVDRDHIVYKPIDYSTINNAIIIGLLNPVVFYQFISAYPDVLFAALFLAALVSIYYMLRADGHYLFSLLSIIFILAAIWVKHHGLILIPILLLMAIYHRKELIRQWKNQSKRIKFSILMFLVMLALINDAIQGDMLLFNMAQNQSNFLGGSNRLNIIQNNIENFLTFCLLTFNLLTPVLILAIIKKQLHGLFFALLLLFILPILYYKGAQYNIRYFIPIIPLLAWLIALQMQSWPITLRRTAMGIFLSLSLILSTYYHHLGFNQWMHQYIALPTVDNLRLLTEQEPELHNLAQIRRNTRQYNNNLIYFSDYYQRGTYGVWQKAGLLPPELNIYYFMQWQPERLEQLGLQSAMVYEYIGVGKPINPMPEITEYSTDMRKISAQLYLWDRSHKL